MTLIDGKAVSQSVKDKIKEQTASLAKSGIRPGLAVIIVGDDPASRVYVNNKKKACEYVGFYSEEYALPEDTSMDELLDLIDVLNSRKDIDGILCQLPLPKHLDETAVINRIAVEKDVDAFSPSNVGKIMIGDYDFLPCTPAGVMEMLKYYNIDPCGKNCVVVGRSNIVGKPMAMLLLHANGTITVCHTKTVNLRDITSRADILVVAVKKANFVKSDMIKDGAVVIDVGMNRNSDGKLCGDVDFDDVAAKCSYITPVPGGVGPMTIAMLMKNTLRAAYLHNNIDIPEE